MKKIFILYFMTILFISCGNEKNIEEEISDIKNINIEIEKKLLSEEKDKYEEFEKSIKEYKHNFYKTKIEGKGLNDVEVNKLYLEMEEYSNKLILDYNINIIK